MREPFQNSRLLPGGNFHELPGFALQLDFIGVDQEEPGSEMPDSAANLPGHQWILVGGIIPNHQHGFRLIQLLHGEKGIGGTFAKRRDESCVISGAVIDRKSTRLNSSHRTISYAVFCLKKKKIKKTHTTHKTPNKLSIRKCK